MLSLLLSIDCNRFFSWASCSKFMAKKQARSDIAFSDPAVGGQHLFNQGCSESIN